MDSKSKKRNFTAEFSSNPVGFMEAHTMTADFGKGLRDNYGIRTDPDMTRPVDERARSGWEKLWGLNKTTSVDEESQRRKTLTDATKALTESGLKTHFLKVMEDKDREGVFNLTPDVKAYRDKFAEKQEKYASLGSSITEKQTKKLAALEKIVNSFDWDAAFAQNRFFVLRT